MKKILTPFYAVLLIFGLQACSSDDDPVPVNPTPPPPPVTIVDTAVAAGDFTTLVAALQATGLDATLADPTGSFTVFAPTDDAFALLGQDTIDALLADTDTLTDILTYHVLGSVVDAAGAVDAAGSTVATVNGKNIAISVTGSTVYINGATVTTTDITTDNGIIHVIDAVLIPPADAGSPTANIVETAVAAGDFTTLVAALEATGLDAALADPAGDFTVFAPTDAAFELLGNDIINALLANPDVLEEVLLQHVVAGSVDSITAFSLNGVNATTLSTNEIAIGLNPTLDTPTFGGANVVMADIYTSNGIIHVIDMVVVGDIEVPEPPISVVQRAIEAGNFTTLVAALQATGLDATLDDPNGTFTVFAPTDDAFAALGQDTIDALLADPDTLASILTYHVLGSVVEADAAIAAAGTRVATVNGADIGISLADSTLYINGATVTANNVLADNGVIHVIDAVLTPPADPGMPTDSIVDVAVGNPDFSTLVAALTAADLVTTLQGDGPFTVFAPTNAAFEMLGQDTIDLLLDPANVDVLTEILTQHVVAGSVDSISAFTLNGLNATTVSTNEIAIGLNAMLDTPTFGGANVTVADIYTSNGIIHVIDMVVVGDVDVPAPLNIVETAVANGSFTTLVTALQATGLDATLAGDGPFTVFAPTDAAFEALIADIGQDAFDALLADTDALSAILTYHVLGSEVPADAAIAAAGSSVATVNGAEIAISLTDNLYINGTTVTANNIFATNGVIHVLDAVLLPPAEAGTPTQNIVEVAAGNPDFSTLVAALTAADLVTTLQGDGPFTVFAPTNAAFAAVGVDNLNFLLDPANSAVLTEVLTQHVVGASVNSIAAFTLNGTNATTVSTNEIPVGINAMLDTPTFGGANVTTADIYTTNGIIHVIDTVVAGDLVLPFTNVGPADFSGVFGGSIRDGDTYTFPTGAEGFAGFANLNADVYPFTFPSGGKVTFTAAIPSGGADTNVRFVFENAPFPDVDPNFSTANVLVSGETEMTYEVAIPAQDPAQTFTSFLMYVVERDQPVIVKDVFVSKPTE